MPGFGRVAPPCLIRSAPLEIVEPGVERARIRSGEIGLAVLLRFVCNVTYKQYQIGENLFWHIILCEDEPHDRQHVALEGGHSIRRATWHIINQSHSKCHAVIGDLLRV